jgi:tetratricopeptide (TPR) repeat protein
MKKIVYLTLLSVFIASCNSNLDNKKVENFVVEHFKNQTIESEAISTFDVNISDSVILFNLSNGWVGRPNWVNDKSKIKTDWFYEDSVATEISDVEIYGEIASVYGNVSFFTNGISTSNAGFHSLVGNEKGKLVFKRHSWMNWNMNKAANSFVWPSSDVEGSLSMYNKMRYAMANLRNNDALAYSDSLVKLDPNLAVAHIGKLHYLFINGKADELVALLDEIKPKLEDATIAERYYIETMTPSSSRNEILKKFENALIYAANDPLLRGWYSYYLLDLDKRIENINIGLKRFPESSLLNNMMGYLMKEKGDYKAAKQYLNVYITIHPEEPNAYDSMGDILLASGDRIQAKEMFLKAYELSRNLKTGPEDFFERSKNKAEAIN